MQRRTLLKQLTGSLRDAQYNNARPAALSSSSCLRRCSRAKSTTAASPETPGFIFDIDGVLKVGEKVLPEGQKALRILAGENRLKRKFPFILCTNGGGITEEERCYKLSKELGVPITIDQLIQAHTPFREHAAKYADQPILVVGGRGDSCREVAHSYGFKKVYTPLDLVSWKPELWPFHKLSKKEAENAKTIDFSQIAFKAIFVFHDSRDWGFDTQIMTDVLASPDGVVGRWKDLDDHDAPEWKEQLPVFFSNPDLLWGNDWPEPRYGQGAFQEAFRAVWKRTTGHELQATTGGKPTNLTYQYAERLLLKQSNLPEILPKGAEAIPKLGPTFMVGDNPFSDIQGSNDYGLNSILVRTGVFRGKDNHHIHPATTVQPDVLAGVRWALERTLREEVVA